MLFSAGFVEISSLVLLIAKGTTSLQITGSPQSVTNATLDSFVTFECTLSSLLADPAWNINGTDYQVTDLPLGYMYKRENYSKLLIIGPLYLHMNVTSLYCYIFNIEGRQESDRAWLIIKSSTLDFSE